MRWLVAVRDEHPDELAATLRASFAFYNTHEEVDAFIAALKKARALLA